MAPRTVRLAALAAAVALTAAGAWAWHTHPHNPGDILALLRQHAHDPAAPLIVVLVYVIGGAVLLPVMALIAVTGLAFGPKLGAIYALLGATASGACAYALGRHASASLLTRYAGPRVEAVRRQLKARGLAAMILVRLIPTGPYTLVNLVAGASGIGFRDFLLGTMIGMTPGILATLGLVHGLRKVWSEPGRDTAAVLIAVAVAVVALAWLLRRAISRRRSRDPR